jgi:hypothetical protein
MQRAFVNDAEDALEIHMQRRKVSACDLAIQAQANNHEQWQQCFTCTKNLLFNLFSKKQQNKKNPKCRLCVEEITKAGAVGMVLQRNHSPSNGLVDGIMHQVAGKKVHDQAIQSDHGDRKEATVILKGFLSQFYFHTQTIFNIANLHCDDESSDRFRRMTFEETKTAIPKKCINDFLPTVCLPPVKHKRFSVLPSTSSSDNCPMNAFID